MSETENNSRTADRSEERPERSDAPSVSQVVHHMTHNKTEVALWSTRLLTLVFTLFYLVPLWPSLSQSSAYQKALLASAATSALRLHQRLPAFRLSREYLALVVLEDSAHYLLYSLLFVYNSCVSLALLPVALFGLLHFSSYSLVLVQKSGLSAVVQQYQRSILQTVALTEIMLMPCLIFAIISGVASLVTPFVYYRFLSLRYSSRRNPYTRQMFRELRLSVEYVAFKPQCPAFVRNGVLAMIGLISRLSPPMVSTN